VGLDLAKRVVSLCGEDAVGRVVAQRTLRREAVLAWFAQRTPCLVGMEACASAHWFARELVALGHTARIIAPAHYPTNDVSDGCLGVILGLDDVAVLQRTNPSQVSF
jgi:transposase